MVQIPPLAPGVRARDLALHIFGRGQRDPTLEVGGRPESLGFGGAEGVGDEDVAEEDDGGWGGGGRRGNGWCDLVVEPGWCCRGRFLKVCRRVCETRESG